MRVKIMENQKTNFRVEYWKKKSQRLFLTILESNDVYGIIDFQGCSVFVLDMLRVFIKVKN